MTTSGKIASFDNTGKLADSIITDTDGGSIGIGTANPDRRLTVQAQGERGLISFKDPTGTT